MIPRSLENRSIEKRILTNGVTVLYDHSDRFRSAAVAITVMNGSRWESAEQNGITHFLEHLFFKRTEEWTTREIAERIDEFGGDVNAFTDPESFTLYGFVPASRTVELFEFLIKLLIHPRFTVEDMELEREVIRQEILEANDDPGDVLYQLSRTRFWGSDGLAQPVFGNEANLLKFQIQDLQKFLEEILVGSRIIVAVAGALPVEELLRSIERNLGHLPRGDRLPLTYPKTFSGTGYIARPVSQTHLIRAISWPHIQLPEYLSGLLLAAVLGQGSSSRLFQLLREERGICYDISVTVDAYPDTAALLISTTIEEEAVDEALFVIDSVLDELRHKGISEEEFTRALRMITAQLELEDDTVRGRVWRAMESEMSVGRYVSAGEIIERLTTLRLDELKCLASWLAGPALTVWGGKVPARFLSESIIST